MAEDAHARGADKGLSMTLFMMSRALAQHRGKPCPYCGERLDASSPINPRAPSREHVLPQSKIRMPGATIEKIPGNVIIVCRRCNKDKGSRYLLKWLSLLRKAGDPRAKHVLAFVKTHPELAAPQAQQKGLRAWLAKLEKTDASPL